MKQEPQTDPELAKTVELLELLFQLQSLSAEVPPEYDQSIWETDGEIVIELGEDFESFYDEKQGILLSWFY